MRARMVTLVATLGLAFALGGWWGTSRKAATAPLLPIAPTPALAGSIASVKDGETFVSTDGGNAYLWRRNGDRIELVGQCVRTVGGPEAQATFVWLPGVERRS